jgi:hypothetical protein
MATEIDKTKDYSEYFECAQDLPESGYCFLPDDMFSTTTQTVIQNHLFSLGYGWERIVTPKSEVKVWNHAYSICWRIIEKDGVKVKDLSWSYDEFIEWTDDRALEKVLFEDHFSPKEQYKGFITGLTFGI